MRGPVGSEQAALDFFPSVSLVFSISSFLFVTPKQHLEAVSTDTAAINHT